MRSEIKNPVWMQGMTLCLAGALLFGLLGATHVSGQDGTEPAAPADEWHVCASGCAFTSVQEAVDAAQAGDVIKIAGGYYTGTQPRRVTLGMDGTERGVAVTTPLVYLTKTVTLRGGYAPDFAEPPDPVAYPTVLDAAQAGSVIHIEGTIAPTIEGLRITGGKNEEGGGIYVSLAAPTIRACEIVSNSATQGGGLYLSFSEAILQANLVGGNQASGSGGGVYLVFSPATLERNQIIGNVSNGRAGGLHLLTSAARLMNTIVAENQATGNGSGIYITATDPPHLLHTTIARNSGGSGYGLYLLNGTAWLTNTLVASQTVGIYATSGTEVHLEGTLWGSGAWANGDDTKGTGSAILGTVALTGEPGFMAPATGDYHIGPLSAAIDRGVATAVTLDVDGEARPDGAAPDIGADEYSGSIVLDQALYLPAVLAP